MRKIERQMNNAIRTGRNFSSANTSVNHDSEGANVYLHGNHIAPVKDTSILLFDRGWQSHTTKSSLNETRTDFVGNLFYSPNDILDFDYNFSYDKNFDGSNYDSVSTTINFNNFITNFNFLSEDGNIGNNEIISNSTTYRFNNENSLKFKTSKDLKNDFTEYYNLIYTYETDCLSASAEFGKKFYRDGSLVPDKSLLFTIRFIPFAELKPAATSLN